MSERKYEDVEFGDDLPEVKPDVGLTNVSRFCKATGMLAGRFMNHEEAKTEGLPGAIVPGIMSQGLLAAMIHRWAPGCRILSLDTVFRAPLIVGTVPTVSGAVTDTDDEARTVELDLTVTTDDGRTSVLGTATVAFSGTG